MLLGIKPTVDFVFKKVFGSPENIPVLIGLLNAILKLAHPIVHVEILNPFSYQEFADDKLIVLDIRARDSAGRWLNIEMQVTVFAGLLQRLVYYACTMYVGQLRRDEETGEDLRVGPVQVAGRLVGQDHLRFASERPGHRNPRLLADALSWDGRWLSRSAIPNRSAKSTIVGSRLPRQSKRSCSELRKCLTFR